MLYNNQNSAVDKLRLRGEVQKLFYTKKVLTSVQVI